MSLFDQFPHRCRIERCKRVADSMGGTRDTSVIEQSNVECWEQQASASEITMWEKRGQSISNKVYFKTDPNITEQHQIVVTHRIVAGVLTEVATSSQKLMTVISIPEPDVSAGMGILWRVMTSYLTGELH